MKANVKNEIINSFEVVVNSNVELNCTVANLFDDGQITEEEINKIAEAEKAINNALSRLEEVLQQIEKAQ